MLRADMAELADALDLGSSGNTRAGSTPVIRIFKSTGNGISRYFFCFIGNFSNRKKWCIMNWK